MDCKLKFLFLGLLFVLCINSVSAVDSLNNMTLDSNVVLDDSNYIVDNTILIDGGGSESKNYNIGKNTVLPYILDKGYTKIDYIIISHFDQDHVRWIVIYYARNKSK